MSISNRQAFLRLMDKCDIYFEDSLISKERIMQKYAEFFASSFEESGHSLLVAQHTGSVCYDVISVLIAALGCLALNETDNEDIIRSFKDGDYVILRSAERCIWRGFAVQVNTIFVASGFDVAEYAILEQPDKGIKNYIPKSRWNRISPYHGTSVRTDGRGLRNVKTNRSDFISYLFDVPVEEIPSVIGVSTVIVTDWELFKRIVDGVRIKYDESKSIALLDLVTASYYTSNLEKQQYGANPAKTEPILKIVSKISAARDLVLDKSGNRTVGFMVLGTSAVMRNNSELNELLERKSLEFSVLTSSMSSEVAQAIIETQGNASVFVCTKEFLLRNSELPKIKNPLTIELNAQVENIINNDVIAIPVESEITWQEVRTLKNAMSIIKRSDIKSEGKDEFIITAHALLNTIMTAVFPLEHLNNAFNQEGFTKGATPPEFKLSKLWELADKQTELVEHFITVVDIIDRLYHSVLLECPKCIALIDLLGKYTDKTVAVIVPKTYYMDILVAGETIKTDNIVLTTSNRFNSTKQYDVVIVVGDFIGARFNPFNCLAAANILVLLYDGETRFFKHKKREAEAYEKSINSRLQIEANANDDHDLFEESESNDISSAIDNDMDLENYINTITAFDIHLFAGRVSAVSGNAPTTDVYAVGHFITGERLFLTRYYQALVFDEDKAVIEKDADSLNPGDILVFAKRDDNTKNMVDYIYDRLQRTGKLSQEIIDATEKAEYWKLVLREYKEAKGISYRDIAKQLREYGLSIQESSIRQWLIDESRIVGPREENTLVQIANLTQDPFLLADADAYFEACRLVREQRRKILELIGKAIADKLSGLMPGNDKLLKFIFDNVDNLSEMLELDDIFVLDKQVSLSAALTNRPVSEMEGMP